MKQSKFTPEQIASILKEFENGINVQEITPKLPRLYTSFFVLGIYTYYFILYTPPKTSSAILLLYLS